MENMGQKQYGEIWVVEMFTGGWFVAAILAIFGLSVDGCQQSAQNGDIFAKTSSAFGCQGVAPLGVQFDLTPIVSEPGTPVTVFAVTSGGTTPFKFDWEWSAEDGWGYGYTQLPTFTFTPPVEEIDVTYVVVVGVTDAEGKFATATKNVTVKGMGTIPDDPDSENQAPVAALSATPISGNAPLNVAFDASASTDPDGDQKTYTWNFGDGSMGKAATGATVSHVYATSGSFTATVTVSDGELSDSATASILVGNPPDTNKPPVAEFTATPTSGDAPLTVAFDASASTDPEGHALTYALDFGDGTGATTVTASHVYNTPGVYTARLVVKDNGGVESPPATVSITVGSPPVDPPSDAGLFITWWPKATKAQTIVLCANVKDLPPGAQVTGSWWDIDEDGTYEITDDLTHEVDYASGVHHPKAKVAFTVGSDAISDDVEVTVD